MPILRDILVLLCIPVCATFLVQSNRPPSIHTQPNSIVYFKYGESVYLPCKADGYPTPTFSWKRNGIYLNPSGNDNRYVQQGDGGSIVINAPEEKDEGVLQCIASNNLGVSVSKMVNLRMGKLNKFPVGFNITHRTQLGDSLVLNCVPPSSVPKANIQWVLFAPDGNIEAVNLNNRISMDFDGRLHIANVQPQDYQEGNAYMCVAINYFMRKNVYDRNQYIHPMGSTPINTPPQYSWCSPSDTFGLIGEEFKLKCIFSGNPTPEVLWSKDNTALPNHYKVSPGGQELTIPNLMEHDAGLYECMGRNNLSSTSRNMNVRVYSKPYWEAEPHDIEAGVGRTVSFICKARGVPDPNIQWFINGDKLEKSRKPVLHTDRFIKPSANNLTFVNLNLNDHMVIQCNASNVHGYVFADVYLNVIGL